VGNASRSVPVAVVQVRAIANRVSKSGDLAYKANALIIRIRGDQVDEVKRVLNGEGCRPGTKAKHWEHGDDPRFTAFPDNVRPQPVGSPRGLDAALDEDIARLDDFGGDRRISTYAHKPAVLARQTCTGVRAGIRPGS
jgi:hypothetical protein